MAGTFQPPPTILTFIQSTPASETPLVSLDLPYTGTRCMPWRLSNFPPLIWGPNALVLGTRPITLLLITLSFAGAVEM